MAGGWRFEVWVSAALGPEACTIALLELYLYLFMFTAMEDEAGRMGNGLVSRAAWVALALSA